MIQKLTFVLTTFTLSTLLAFTIKASNVFPDGTPIPEWFNQKEDVDISLLGDKYCITDYDVIDDSILLQTTKIQAVIDLASKKGGVVVIPEGTYLSGSLFFKPNTHLYLAEGAVLKGSDDISNFPVIQTRMEGQSLKYFAALVNADGVDGFTVSGKGTLDGNGLRFWKSFWLRREVNPQCTNMEELRPRLLYVSNSKNVQVTGITLMNSPFWTSHYYKCEYLRLNNLTFLSPEKPVKAPSTDAIDLDVCSNVLVQNCYISVNDDGIALKGGKGPHADVDANNGGNYNIIIEDCEFGFCHSALTCGSESIHNRNIIFRRSKLDGALQLLHLKMRPDTPQNYEYILVEDITGNAGKVLSIRPWTQFFDLKGEEKMLMSYSSNIKMRNVDLECDVFLDIVDSDQYKLTDFSFINVNITSLKKGAIDKDILKNVHVENVKLNGVSL